MRLIVELVDNNITQILESTWIKTWLVGTIDSYDCAFVFSMEQIKEIVRKAKRVDKKVMVNVNRLFFEHEVSIIMEKLKTYIEMGVDYFLYSDMLVSNVLTTMGYGCKLVYYAPTYLTNYYDINELLEINDNIVLSHLLSYSEWETIIKSVKRPIIVYTFGLPSLFYSRRPLLSNYLQYRKLSKINDSCNYFIKEELREELLKIEEKENSCVIYEAAYYYLDEEIRKLNDFLLFLSFKGLDSQKQEQVIKFYETILDENKIVSTYLEGIVLSKGRLTRKTVLLKEGDDE